MSANTGPKSAARFEFFANHVSGHCSSDGRVMDSGHGGQRFDPSSSVIFIHDILFNREYDPKGEQEQQQQQQLK